MATCASCREELAACMRLASTVPVKRRSIPWTWLGTAAAAAIVLVVIARPRVDPRERGEPVERGHLVGKPELMVPSDVVVRRPDLRFMWRSDGAGTTYRVIVDDVNGAPVWNADVPDTTTTVPMSMQLIPGARYYWRVEALHPDGSIAKSQMLSFTIAQ